MSPDGRRPLPKLATNGHRRGQPVLRPPHATATSRKTRDAKDPFMQAVLYVLLRVLDFYMYILIASAIMSWLVAFNVVNLRNQVVAAIASLLYTMTEPLLRPIRRFMPNTGGLDLSFLVLWFGIILLQQVIIRYVYPYVF